VNKKQLLENLKNDIYCRIGISSIHGVGVIAIRDIPKGTNPFVGSCQCEYIAIDNEDIKTFPKEVKKIIDDFYLIKGEKMLIPSCGLNSMDISYYMNFSDTPNVSSRDRGTTFFTNRDIKTGEELTLDYINDYGKEHA
jgi:SET domain-containing protein